jgi:hypothetical protein
MHARHVIWLSIFHIAQATCDHAAVLDADRRRLCTLWRLIHIRQAIAGIPDAKLRNCAHLSSDPRAKNLTSLLLSEPGSWEITLRDEGNNIHDDLMLVQYGVHDNWNNGT